jgi:hypothetical protein
MFDACRIGEKEPVVGPSFQVNDVTVSICSVEKGADWIGSELRQYSDDRITARSRRIGR